ncbi:MAG: aminopeptidase P family protein [Anaerolineae bacterium]
MRELLAENGLDGMLVTQPENRRYLSGFTGSAGVLVITGDRQAIATDFRYYDQVRAQCPGWELVEVGYDFVGHMLDVLRDLGLGGRPVGFEASHVTVDELLGWERALKGHVQLINTTRLVEQMRVSKDATELQAIRRAAKLADEALAHIYDWMQPGMTERQVAWELEATMRTSGATSVSFEIIVASGPNGALPHMRPTDRVIQNGEPVIMDLGCVVDGYCSDVTRTVCLGEPEDEEYLKVWDLVLAAQQRVESNLRAGITGVAGDQLARQVIDQAGYGDYFGHGLGHGVGLAIHEDPRLSRMNAEPIPDGAVVTVEPGVYMAGWGGVRLEDMVVVHEDGVEVLASAAKMPLLVR